MRATSSAYAEGTNKSFFKRSPSIIIRAAPETGELIGATVGGQKLRNASPNFFLSKPLESHETAKKKFAKIWSARTSVIEKKGTFKTRNFAQAANFCAIQGFSKLFAAVFGAIPIVKGDSWTRRRDMRPLDNPD